MGWLKEEHKESCVISPVTCPFTRPLHAHPPSPSSVLAALRFTEWPSDALFEVASKQLQNEDLGTEDIKNAICKVRRRRELWSHKAF